MALTAYDDEVISGATGVVHTLDSSKLSSANQSPATRVVIEVETGLNNQFLYRFNTDPDASSGAEIGYRLSNEEQVTIDGHENLVNLKLLLVGTGTPGRLFVTYYR